jgi:alginate O-acetyltransferase complex protein AlgI
MHFLSVTWIAWLLGVVGLFWLLPARQRHAFLVLATAAFLAAHSLPSLILLIGFTAATVMATRPGARQRLRIWAAALAMLTALVGFKLLSTPSGSAVQDLAIPLGLSYYTFRCLHVLFDTLRGTARPVTPPQLVAYLFFLPTIVIGPIHRMPAFLRDRLDHCWTAAAISGGLERVVIGYFKIAVVGNFLVAGQLGSAIRGVEETSPQLAAYLAIVQIGLNLYVQFSGFSDVAIGFARLLGYRVIENFDWPYFARNIGDFWRRWHISLASWSRDYVYMPLLGLTRNPYWATIACFLVIGLWHEVSLRYAAWGLYHGLGIIGFQQWQALKRRLKLPQARPGAMRALAQTLSVALTVHYVWLGFALVRQPDLAAAAALLRKLVGVGGY